MADKDVLIGNVDPLFEAFDSQMKCSTCKKNPLYNHTLETGVNIFLLDIHCLIFFVFLFYGLLFWAHTLLIS